jgi:carboxyl-terminal processing protease
LGDILTLGAVFMRITPRAASILSVLALATALGLPAPGVLAQDVRIAAAAESPLPELAAGMWESARAGRAAEFDGIIDRLAANPEPGLRAAAARYRDHVAQRETNRAQRLAEVWETFDKALAAPTDDLSNSKALRAAIELHMLSPDKEAILAEPRIQALISRCDAAAHAAEVRGDTLTAGEMFVLLDALLDIRGVYKPDVRRIGARQEMLRLYVPQRLYELRAERARREDASKPFPPYNPFGDDWKTKLASIDQTLVERAIQYGRRHVTQPKAIELVRGGLENVRTMVTTADLAVPFPGLGDAAQRNAMIAFLDAEESRLGELTDVDAVQIGALIDRLRRKNDTTVRINTLALLHEFGNGAMSRLDDFSEIIWPDEVRRFQKNTQGRFVGVGIQIEYDELQNIRVVTPIEGTPAQRAGIHAGDVITKVDGRNIFGLSLDQAVDVITGPENTTVTLTIERAVEDTLGPGDGDPAPTPPRISLDFPLKRSVIKVATVKGWQREGAREDAWNWFIDQEKGIGYVRLSQFADSTGAELDRAIGAMKAQGLRGLIVDLRFNPGGLLDQAVRIAQRFIDSPDGYIVASKGPAGRIEEPYYTEPSAATLARVPVAVLINEGSASASEIVSGAISRFAHEGKSDAVVVGARSYGKGSVQNVWNLTSSSLIKVTTAYYMLPGEIIIHRRPGDTTWGVEPDLRVEMLPKQTSDAILARRDADVLPINENGVVGDSPKADAADLIANGTDLQLEAALLLLKGRLAGESVLARTSK